MKDFLLTIDNGNTNPKFFLLKDDNSSFELIENSSIQDLSLIFKNYKLTPQNTDIIISCVGKKDEAIQSLRKNFEVISVKDFIDEKKFLDMPMSYTKSIGEDRIVQAYYLYKNFSGKLPLLLVDSGSFTTCDLISVKGFEGGYILPGLELLSKSYSMGANLPVFSPEETREYKLDKLAHTTKDAIINTPALLTKSFLDSMTENFQSTDTVITGGNAKLVEKMLSSSILDEELLFKSLLFFYDVVSSRRFNQ
jgi:pantothenate kinase type III